GGLGTIVLRPGEDESLLAPRMAQQPPGSVLTRDPDGTRRALPPGGAAGSSLAGGSSAGGSSAGASLVGVPGIVDITPLAGGQVAGRTTLPDAAVAALPGVTAVQPDFIRTASDTGAPNDTYWGQQWALSNTGQRIDTNGTPGADIKAVSAWSRSRGDGIA